MQIETIEILIEKLTTFPGISKKQAEKMANFLIKKDESYLNELINAFANMKQNISFCQRCNFIVEYGKCLSCEQEEKQSTLMILESCANVKKIAQMEFFQGYFYVLEKILTIKNQLANETINYQHLIDFINLKNIKEVIIVLSPSLDGELTTNYLVNLLSKLNIKVTRAAIGMPMNSNIDYLDTFTIKQAIENRK